MQQFQLLIPTRRRSPSWQWGKKRQILSLTRQTATARCKHETETTRQLHVIDRTRLSSAIMHLCLLCLVSKGKLQVTRVEIMKQIPPNTLQFEVAAPSISTLSRAKNLDRFKGCKDVLVHSLHVSYTSDVVPAVVFPNRPVQPLKKPQTNIFWLKASMRPSHTSLSRPQSGKNIKHVGTLRFRFRVTSSSPAANFFLPKKPFGLGETWRTKLRKIPDFQACF